MSADTMIQEEIDALLNGASSSEPAEQPEPTEEITQQQKDIIGEVGNISMSQAATTLSSLMNRQVNITTPRVSVLSYKEMVENAKTPKVTTTIEFKEGLTGHNMLMINIRDAV